MITPIRDAFTVAAALLLFAPPALRAQPTPWPKLTDNYRHYCFDFNWVDRLDRNGKPLSDYSKLSAQDHVEQLEAMHADSLMVFCMSISGYMFYDSKVGERHPTLQYDYLKEMIRLGHEKGMAMELYVPTMWADRLIQKNPSWGMRTPEGDLYTAAFGGYHPDINSPAADWYVDVIRELIPAYHGDAFFADGMTFAEYGQSEYTVKRFREEMKRDYPHSLAEDPDWRGTVRWEVAQVDRFWNKLKSAIKERDPKVQVTFNGPGPMIEMPGARRGWVAEPPHLDASTDYAFTEAGSGGEYATWTRGAAWPKPFKVTFLNRNSILDPFDADEIRARMGRTLAEGGEPYRYDRTSINGEANRYFTETWAPIFEEVRRKEPYIKGAEPVKYVAVLSSEPTMFYRGRSDAGSHANDLVGALRMLDGLHIQHDVVADWNLTAEFLEPYRLVILPNTGCMSDAQVAAVREYVRQGGTILATAETSLFDENGGTRADFALGDVFGVKFDEPPSNAIRTAEDRRPVYVRPARTEHEVLRRLPQTDLIIPGDSAYARPRQGQATAALIEDAGTPAPSPAKVTERTALQVNDFGKGKAIWICGTIFAHSSFRSDAPSGVEWVNGFVNSAVEYLAPSAPWRLKGSSKVWAGLSAQAANKRYVMHLVNWQTDLPADVEITIPDGYGVGKNAAVIWPSKQALRGTVQGGATTYSIPRVGPHVMVTFEQ